MPSCARLSQTERSPSGSPSGTSLPAALSSVWHQPGLLRALTLTHLQLQPLGRRRLAAGAAGAARLPWGVEGLVGVAEVGAPQMKQGSQQHHWGGQVEVMGLKCREQKLDSRHGILQPTDKVTLPLPTPWPDKWSVQGSTTKHVKNGKRCLYQWSVSYTCVLLRDPVTDSLLLPLLPAWAGVS